MTRAIAIVCGGLIAALALLAGCRSHMDVQESGLLGGGSSVQERSEIFPVPDGTRLRVRLTSRLSSASSEGGDDWEGVLIQPVIVNDHAALHEGSVVHGMVKRVDHPDRDQAAALELAVTGVEEDGEMIDVDAGTPAVIAGRSQPSGSDVELRPGAVMTFTVSSTVSMR